VKRKEEIRKRFDFSAIVIQKYIRAWRDRKEIIARVVERMLELKEFELKKIQEVEEQRKILQEWNIKESQKLKRMSRDLESNNLIIPDKPLSKSQNVRVNQSIRPPQINTSNLDQYSDSRLKRDLNEPVGVSIPQDPLLSPRERPGNDELLSPRKKMPDKVPPNNQNRTGGGMFKVPTQNKSISKIQGFLSQHTSRNISKANSTAKPPVVTNTAMSNRGIRNNQVGELTHNVTSERKLRGRSRSVDSVPFDFVPPPVRK